MKGMWDRYIGRVDSRRDRHELRSGRAARRSCCGKCQHAAPGTSMRARQDQAAACASGSMIVEGKRPVDWAVGEQAAFATLMADGYHGPALGAGLGARHVQPSPCGDHRHPDQRRSATRSSTWASTFTFHAIDSSLSELGVLGFEVGYAFDTPGRPGVVGGAVRRLRERRPDHHRPVPHGLGAEVGALLRPRDAASARLRGAGAGALLRHGSSASCRPVRKTTCRWRTAPRRRTSTTCCGARCCGNVRAPLVVMTPKSLLRHPRSHLHDSTSSATGALPARDRRSGPDVSGARASRRVLQLESSTTSCSQRPHPRDEIQDVALVRTELLYPFPATYLQSDRWRCSPPDPSAEVVWCQEEPRNMGRVVAHDPVVDGRNRRPNCLDSSAALRPRALPPARTSNTSTSSKLLIASSVGVVPWST